MHTRFTPVVATTCDRPQRPATYPHREHQSSCGTLDPRSPLMIYDGHTQLLENARIHYCGEALTLLAVAPSTTITGSTLPTKPLGLLPPWIWSFHWIPRPLLRNYIPFDTSSTLASSSGAMGSGLDRGLKKRVMPSDSAFLVVAWSCIPGRSSPSMS